MKKYSEKILHQGHWLTFKETVYINIHGEEIKWEHVERSRPCVSMVIIPQMLPSKRMVLIKQYRPAIDGYILGFPAGLVENDPTEALRELKEETGYVGKIVNISPLLKTNSGVINDSGYVVFATIDENDPLNQNPQQELEPSEEIEVILLAQEDIKDFILSEYAKGTHMGGGLWYLFGIQSFLST